MTSDDSLLNEYEWVDVDSHDSFNNAVHLDDDDDEVPDGEYYGETDDDEEQFLGNELELYDVDQEMENDFTDNDVVVGPISEIRYRDKDSLFAFYKEYARLKGFSVVKRNSNKKGGDTTRYITYCCDMARIRKTKFTTKGNNCKARRTAILDDSDCWRVSKVVHDHNHDFLPSISRLMAEHRSLCDSLKRDFVAHDRSGIRLSKNIRLVKVKDKEFFYSIDVDNIGRLRNVVWVHSHRKAAYEQFHDAICFDTTYIVNRYNMPCATFIGINHHRQSILLGCALMYHKDIDSYKLVFRTWLEAMGIVHPNASLTDQCPSIKPTIAEAGILLTQRSEGMHEFFDGYITSQSTLRMFIHQYELAIRAKHDKELEAKYRSKGIQIVSESLFKWEEQVIQCYMRTMYELFKTQLRKLYHWEVNSPDDHQAIPGVEKFIVTQDLVAQED
ncbi:protein FAR-RED IMPAIRED RESPONSE 1-like [Nicotiana tabacum]|uniref:Protein FAR-RED IMPAIRED RESPONSE 1-like n=1 Tax=Nicotiana tabacum TaxID=4097 RepID=A0AC58U298_TOBAC